MTKRDIVLQLAETGKPGPYTPASFFLHFPPDCHRGQAAVDKHVEYFRATDNDLMKIQYEFNYPLRPELHRPDDWSSIKCFGADDYEGQVEVVAGVVKELKAQAVVIVTLYSAYMFASQMTGWDLLDKHMQEDPVAVTAGLEIITESMLTFIRACLDVGVDGFYASSQGGEAGRFADPSIFDRYIKPLELRIWEEIDSKAALNVLHICDYERPYDTIDRFTDYPGQIVSAPLHLTGSSLTGAEAARLFGRPFLGGMERLQALSTGPVGEVTAQAQEALATGPPAMILGADCTLAASADWNNIAAATAAAHSHTPAG